MSAVIVAACGGGPILANPQLDYPAPVGTGGPPAGPVDPIPVELPRDDGPHARLTEWWYYTGHLEVETGRRFGFEAVVFRAERGSLPPSWAAHLALTDEGGQRFTYAQRSEIGPQVDRSPRDGAGTPTGFDLPGRRAESGADRRRRAAVRASRGGSPARMGRTRSRRRSPTRRRRRPAARSAEPHARVDQAGGPA